MRVSTRVGIGLAAWFMALRHAALPPALEDYAVRVHGTVGLGLSQAIGLPVIALSRLLFGDEAATRAKDLMMARVMFWWMTAAKVWSLKVDGSFPLELVTKPCVIVANFNR